MHQKIVHIYRLIITYKKVTLYKNLKYSDRFLFCKH